MKLNLLVATSQLNSVKGRSLGTGTIAGLHHLSDLMVELGIRGDIYDLPNGSRSSDTASPFSLNSGFALNPDELDLFLIPELNLNKSLFRFLTEIELSYKEKFSSNRRVSYTLKRSLLDLVLRECFKIFITQVSIQRNKEFESFLETARYWINEYALFALYKEKSISLDRKEYREVNHPKVLKLVLENRERLLYHRYIQFLCFEQRQNLIQALDMKKIGIIVNLPFGIECHSPDVYFHPEVFDQSRQVGCSPEPQNGYPEQAWGIAAYREKTPGLKDYLIQRLSWIRKIGSGIFIDHLVGWCGQYTLPMRLKKATSGPNGRFTTENEIMRKENLRWFLDLAIQCGLEIRGEIAGDAERVKVTQNVLKDYIKKGENISGMAIVRWENDNWKRKPLKNYSEKTLLTVETHDTSTLLQYLLNKKGSRDDFEDEANILDFCRRVLGLPFVASDIPLSLEEISDEFSFEIVRRLCFGSKSEEVLFSLSSLISLLCPAFRKPDVQNNINLQPGTSGEVGNEWNNWSFFSPPIERMVEDRDLRDKLLRIGKREIRFFDYFHDLEIEENPGGQLSCVFSDPKDRPIVYRGKDKKWSVLKMEAGLKDINIEAELVIFNLDDMEHWGHVQLEKVIDLNFEGEYRFLDLNQDGAQYIYLSASLKEDLLFVKLDPGQIHHFLVHKITSEIG
ncbi:MAG: 4-alpha-glucanotransferase [Deltaproteobacteria bacterium]|nr:4-alpha-glucanotransferase [Deltaproteobacteria bacterium]